MATYLPGLTDQIPTIQPFQPNFGLVQKALSTLQSKYDQGFASVKNAYSQVLNAAISNPELRMERDGYVKTAETELKNLSSVDLSLQENQVAAENVFAPFWEDNRILTDTRLTRSMLDELQKAANVRDSTDDKVREQYNDLSVEYIQNGLEKLKNTDPNSPEFTRIQARRWVPFANLEKYLNEQAKADNLEIKWSSPSGPYLLKMNNGPRAIIPFKTWAHNMLGNNFREQFGIMGTLEKEEGVKELMRNNPLITEAQAIAMLAGNTIKGMSKSYADRAQELDESIKKTDAQISWYADQPLSQQDAQATLQPLKDQRDALAEQQKNLKEEQDKFNKNYTNTLNDITKNPDNYFASVNKQRVVDGWANARAANQSTDMQINPLLQEENTNNYRKEQLKLEYLNYDLKNRMFAASFVDTDDDGVPDTYKGALAGNNSGTGDGNSFGTGGNSKLKGTKKADKESTALSGEKLGYGITDISQTGNAFDVLQREQSSRWSAANENFFDAKGVARVLTAKMGLEPKVARDFISELKRYTADPKNYKMDNKNNWVTNILTSLQGESSFKTSDPEGIRNAMVEIAGKYLKEKLNNGGEKMEAGDREMVQKYMMGISALQQYKSTEQSIKDETVNLFKSTHDFDMLKVTHNGEASIITSDDLAKDFKKSKYKLNGENISRDQLAQLYTAGEIMFWHDPKRGFQLRVGNALINREDDAFDLMNEINTMDKKYESSANFKDKMTKLNARVVPNIPEFQNKTGKFGFRMQYDLTDKDNDFGARLLKEAANADNRLAIYEGTERSNNTDLNKAVIGILEQGEPELEKFVSAGILNTWGVNGTPMLEVVFKPVSDSNKTTVGGYDLRKLAGKKIAIELNPNASGEAIRSIRYNSGFYVYGDMLRGKEITADAVLKSSGFDFSVLPNDDKDPSYVTVHIQRTVFDETTGKNKQLDPIDRDIYFSQVTPDEIMGTIYSMLDKHLAGNVEANERYKSLPSGEVKKSGKEWMEDWKNKRPPF
jgi:hypothetical protein